MRIVRPISSHDAHMLERSIALMRHFGRLENHSITFAPAQSVAHLAEEEAAGMADLCADITVLPLEFEGDGTWPQSPNRHWALTMEALRIHGSTDPVFWMELDCDPVTDKWADMLESGWRSGRQPFYGKTVLKPSRNEAGAIIYEPDDLMMMGCAVYPPNITGIKNWDVLVKGFHTGTNTEPWDVFMRGWMRGAGWTHTDLIGDRWNTQNYRMENGKLVCDPAPTQFRGRDHSRTDISGACVIHGCKDGSLARLILSGVAEWLNADTRKTAYPETSTSGIRASESSGIAAKGSTPFPSHLQSELDAMRAENAELKATLAKMEQNRQPLSTSPDDARRDSEAQSLGALHETKAVVEIETIRGIVNAKKMQLGALSKVTKIPKDNLRKLILLPDSGMKLGKKPFEWVILAA